MSLMHRAVEVQPAEVELALGSRSMRTVAHLVVATVLAIVGLLFVATTVWVGTAIGSSALVAALLLALFMAGAGAGCLYTAWVYVADILAPGSNLRIANGWLEVRLPQMLAAPLKVPLSDVIAAAVSKAGPVPVRFPIFVTAAPATREQPVGYLVTGSHAAFPTLTAGALEPNFVLLFRSPVTLSVRAKLSSLGRRSQFEYRAGGLLLSVRNPPAAVDAIAKWGLVGQIRLSTLDLVPGGSRPDSGAELLLPAQFVREWNKWDSVRAHGFPVIGAAGERLRMRPRLQS